MSTTLFTLLIFFSVTGITLNHLDWVSTSSEPELYESQIPTRLIHNFTPPVTDSLLNWFATKHNLNVASNIEWDEESLEVLLDYQYPAGFAYVVVDTDTGNYSIDYQKGSFWQIVNDLHKGRHAGTTWSWLIDISAFFMVFFSITGLIILWQNRPKRRVGIVLTLLGTITPYLLFLFAVPNLTGVN